MTRVLVPVVVLALAGAANAQLITGFEPPTYSGSTAGTVLTGQNNWYVPVAGSSDFNVYPYVGNSLNIPANPGGGGSQFVANVSQLNPALGRAQYDVDFSSGGLWAASWDVYVRFDGTSPATQFPGSFSLQNSATDRYFQQLMSWDDVNNPTTFTINYLSWQADGTPTPGSTIGLPGAIPAGAGWQGLSVNNWYRETIVWDFTTNRIVSLSLTDLHTNQMFNAAPADWYLFGGTNPTRPMPTGIRLFTGGANGGNVTAWDNIAVIPAPGAASILALGLVAAARRRRR